MIVDEHTNRSLFRRLTRRNLLWQYDFLIDSIHIGLDHHIKLTDYIIRSLNFFAVVNIAEGPGVLRDDDVYIEGAEHEPPGRREVKQEYLDSSPAFTKYGMSGTRFTWRHMHCGRSVGYIHSWKAMEGPLARRCTTRYR